MSNKAILAPPKRSLKERRLQLGLTLADVGAQLSISVDTVRRIEGGRGSKGHAKHYVRYLQEYIRREQSIFVSEWTLAPDIFPPPAPVDVERLVKSHS